MSLSSRPLTMRIIEWTRQGVVNFNGSCEDYLRSQGLGYGKPVSA